MRGPWSKKTPQVMILAPAGERAVPKELRKAKRVAVAAASEKTKATG